MGLERHPENGLRAVKALDIGPLTGLQTKHSYKCGSLRRQFPHPIFKGLRSHNLKENMKSSQNLHFISELITLKSRHQKCKRDEC